MAEHLAFEPIEYRSADGRLRLFARDYPAQSGGEKLPPLLMMHGLTRNSADFEPLIDALRPANRLIVPDQRGRGQSDYDPDPSNYRPDIYVEDMWALLADRMIDTVIPVGTSMGGLMSMIMAAQQPDRVAAIVLNDIGPVVDESGLDRIRDYVGGGEPSANWPEAAARCEAINRSAMEGFTAKDWLAFAARTCVEKPDGTVAFAYDPAISQGMEAADTTAVPPDLWAMWDALVDIPVAVIGGAASDILSAPTVADMARRHRGRFMHAEVPGRGHAPLLDEPEAVALIAQLLASLD